MDGNAEENASCAEEISQITINEIRNVYCTFTRDLEVGLESVMGAGARRTTNSPDEMTALCRDKEAGYLKRYASLK